MARSRWLAAALTSIVVIGPMAQMTAVAQTPPAPPPRVPGAPPTVIVPAPPPAAPPTVIVPAPLPAAPPTVVVPGPAVIVPGPPPATTPTPPSGVVTVPPASAPSLPMQSMQPETVPDMDGVEPGVGAKIGAGVLNVVYVPGKAIICTAGTLVAGGFMLLTFGSAYREATSFFNEGCRGRWVITPEQVAAAPKRAQLQQ